MSRRPAFEPDCADGPQGEQLLIIAGRTRDIGHFEVRRILPAVRQRMVGPFVFFDHFGPVTLPAGQAVDVRPHPHVHLATVTYLFEGAQVHRDSLGSVQRIEPGAVNWMNAGAGIVHSERSPDDQRNRDSPIHGIQAWVALPIEAEHSEPTFQHVPAHEIPTMERDGLLIRVLAGQVWGKRSPVRMHSRLFYLEVHAPDGGILEVHSEWGERAVYVVRGEVALRETICQKHQLLVLKGSDSVSLRLAKGTQVMVLGGENLGRRHIDWNFVGSGPELIKAAKRRWREQEFPLIETDREEFIPLPDE